MPRREAADDEDRMSRCPRCKGNTTVYDIRLNTEIECPVCMGTGRATRAQLRAHHNTSQS